MAGERMMHRALLSIGVKLLMTMPVSADDLPPAPQPPEATEALALDLLKTLVETNTTHAHGSTAAAELLAGRLRTGGLAPEDVTLIAPADHPGFYQDVEFTYRMMKALSAGE
jgi:hypothetical protein